MHRTICDYMLDVVQNSIEAGSAVVILDLIEEDTVIKVFVSDDGKGMTEDELARVTDPFYSDGTKHEKRKVGLGLAFLNQAVAMTGGFMDIRSEKGKGTSVAFSFDRNHLDTPPLGDVVATFIAMLSYPGEHELVVHRSVTRDGKNGSYTIRRKEMIDVLGDIEMSDSLSLLRSFIMSQEEDCRCAEQNTYRCAERNAFTFDGKNEGGLYG